VGERSSVMETLESRTFLSSGAAPHAVAHGSRASRHSPVLAASFFLGSTEGWQVIGDPVLPAPNYQYDGSGGGYIAVTDLHDGANMFWLAPEPLLGKKSAAYGGTLSFDLFQSTMATQENDADVILQGRARRGQSFQLFFTLPTHPGTTWTHYDVPLTETAGWRVTTPQGTPATQKDFRAMLKSLRALLIRAEYSDDVDTDGLDNVVLKRATT
jgi:Laminin B (Domain IV)